jgi:antitoxin (DNA-binding transcriptional repressor) of toxin-antitoxin stability system
MQVSISEFRAAISKYFLAALNGEPVWITKGGVTYELRAILPIQHQLNVPELDRVPHRGKQ